MRVRKRYFFGEIQRLCGLFTSIFPSDIWKIDSAIVKKHVKVALNSVEKVLNKKSKKMESLGDITIVGIGSSAGGLEAITALVSTLPEKVNASYVVVQHLSPTHKSLMTELVARQTKLLVTDVTDGTIPQLNTIYITPRKTDVVFEKGQLRLVEPSPELGSPKPCVDRFLTSLADSHAISSMAIILSGTGTDGAYGVKAIREAGGITIAQDSESAKYDGMPNSAVQTGCVDLILSPNDIGTHLKKILSTPRDFTEFRRGTLEETPISDLLQILLARTKVDFREYKQATIGRRIERRMVALGIETQEEYTQYCRNDPLAIDALFRDLLISVTRFFRDKEEFNQLRSMLPKLIQERGDGQLRIWIAGCATGEEAYSIAMLISEALDSSRSDLKSRVQIFATDLDGEALAVARKGVYSAAVLNDIPADLADKYLIRESNGVRVVDSLRNAILFSDHNVCQDPPFQRIDLLCCRNLLIYFGHQLQQKVMTRFHYSMNSHAIMFLGSAESAAGSDDLFVQDKTSPRVFRKRLLGTKDVTFYSMPNNNLSQKKSYKRDSIPADIPSTDRLFFEGLASSLGKNSILVTEDNSIARIYGNVSAFIEMSGKSNLKMHTDLLRSPLREEARSLVSIAFKTGAYRSGVRHLFAESDCEEIRLDVYPIIAKEISERAALIVFTPIKIERTKVSKSRQEKIQGQAATERIQALEKEVSATREALQQTIEQLETSNEELQSLNEELQSTNEELQAANEELETSNEELQSTNEELITVNEELQVTASELTGRTGELNSVLESTPIAIVVTDSALQVTQATTSAVELFQIQRPFNSPHISQCSLPEGFPSLAPICSEALTLGQTITKEFGTKTSRFELICSPYFDFHGKVLGVTVISLEQPAQARELEMILSTSQVYLMNRTREGKILRISNASARALGLSREEAIGKNVYEILEPSAGEKLRQDDTDFLQQKSSSHFRGDVEVITGENGKETWLSADLFMYRNREANEQTVYEIASDVTDFVIARKEAEALAEQLRVLQEFAGSGYWSIDLETRSIDWSRQVYKIHRLSKENFKPDIESAFNFFHPNDREAVAAAIASAAENGGEFKFIKRLLRDGETITVDCHGLGVPNDQGKVEKIVGIFRELSDAPRHIKLDFGAL